MKNFWKKSGLLSLSLIAATLQFSPMSSARGHIDEAVEAELAWTEEIPSQAGFRKEYEDRDFPASRDYVSYSFNLEKGKNYANPAACDADCSDIDSIILDENDAMVDIDNEGDDVLIVTITPERNQEYTFYVGMIECATETCAIGVNVMSR